jgi:hypothetical protein
VGAIGDISAFPDFMCILILTASIPSSSYHRFCRSCSFVSLFEPSGLRSFLHMATLARVVSIHQLAPICHPSFPIIIIINIVHLHSSYKHLPSFIPEHVIIRISRISYPLVPLPPIPPNPPSTTPYPVPYIGTNTFKSHCSSHGSSPIHRML